MDFGNLGSIKSPDGQCLENWKAGGAPKLKIILVGPKQFVSTIVLNKNGK